LKKKIKAIDEDLSYREIMRKVNKIKAITLKFKDEELIIGSDLEEQAYISFKAAKCAIPPIIS